MTKTNKAFLFASTLIVVIAVATNGTSLFGEVIWEGIVRAIAGYQLGSWVAEFVEYMEKR